MVEEAEKHRKAREFVEGATRPVVPSVVPYEAVWVLRKLGFKAWDSGHLGPGSIALSMGSRGKEYHPSP